MEALAAIQSGDCSGLKNLIEQKKEKREDLDQLALPLFGGGTLLHYAANSSPECCQILLEDGIFSSVDVKDDSGATPLMWACGEGNKGCVELLLHHQASVSITDFGGETPLHWAALNGHLDCIKLLLAHGAPINAKAANGFTPLHNATINNRKNCVSYLINSGSDLTIQDKTGRRAEDIAKTKGDLINYFDNQKREFLEKIEQAQLYASMLTREIDVLKIERDQLSRKLMHSLKQSTELEQHIRQLELQLQSLSVQLEEERQSRIKIEDHWRTVTQDLHHQKDIHAQLEAQFAQLSSQKAMTQPHSRPTSSGSLDVNSLNKLLGTFSELQNLLQTTISALDTTKAQIGETMPNQWDLQQQYF